MIDGSKELNCLFAFELQSSRFIENGSNCTLDFFLALQSK